MANRPIYHAITKPPFYEAIHVDFQFYSGFSLSQKQKCIKSLHEAYLNRYPDRNVLEISSKSTINLGISLSAFNLTLTNDTKTFSVECAFQGSKVFENGGPYIDLFDKTSREAKKDERLKTSGALTQFQYFNNSYPLEPKDLFYNWLYINALSQNKELAEQLLCYDSFSDIEFNPQKSINCQAKAAAAFVGLSTQHILSEALSSNENFLKFVYGKCLT